MKRIIAFTGHKGNGKTTAAEYIKQRFMTESDSPIKVERINMKDSLIDEMVEKFPMLLEELSKTYEMTVDNLFKQKPSLMRKLMQDFGLMRRIETPGYWVDKWEEKVKNSSSDLIIVDDTRFFDEYDAIGRHGGQVYKIVKEGQINDDFHATETEISMIPCPEIRAKDKEDLFNQLDKIIL